MKDLVGEHPPMAIVISGRDCSRSCLFFSPCKVALGRCFLEVALIILQLGAIFIMKLTFWPNILLVFIRFCNAPYWIVGLGVWLRHCIPSRR